MRLLLRTAGLALAVALSAPLGATPTDAATVPDENRPPGSAAAERGLAHHSFPRHQRLSFGERTVRIAEEYEGVPYRSGGTSPRGFDCSGFTRFVFGKLHQHIPRSSQEQYDAAQRVRNPQIGDLIFYHSGQGGGVYHVAIYAGHGKVWHSPRPGERVRKERIWTSYWTAGRFSHSHS
jgi:cell wall-associated NlpC family hydrolase